ncbi:hypothetical protein L210DRAFT_359545 [Boletus edulis BED1]|uniref:Uncharacterized protein n=1 Tax=Boletus edulis BED1 TaxID=1328754 RepID=A0AAD4GB92_BOLED|nr:hypothetical protein L210DRAFT_359545 [Boletus edulis BED1]
MFCACWCHVTSTSDLVLAGHLVDQLIIRPRGRSCGRLVSCHLSRGLCTSAVLCQRTRSSRLVDRWAAHVTPRYRERLCVRCV